ncbi:MAG: ketoacyl-ACP synthase III [Synergistaceae bacterium]|nr:beta-ketoacyl-ACP synthase III [Synergistota bacterium]NLM70909.1 ketoacyl-ACP synthase III [Synergistaceae bacterium]
MALFQGVPAAVRGIGRHVPERVLTNEDLSRMVDTSDEWIRERTGIQRRHIAEAGELTSELALKAGRAALEDAGVSPNELDMVIVATNSPDTLFPGVAPKVQGLLGADRAGAFDVQSGCTSGVYSIALGVSGIASGIWRNVLVIGAEVLSALIDWSDRNTCVLFGDGAGAVLLAPSEGRGRFLSAGLRSDGTKHDQITLLGGLVEHPASQETLAEKKHFVTMKGNDVFKFVNRVIPPFLKELCEDSGLSVGDIDWWFFHQANRRIIERAAERLGIAPDRVFINLDEYGNTSAASVFIALSDFAGQGRLVSGQRLLLTAFGAGMTYGGVIYET